MDIVIGVPRIASIYDNSIKREHGTRNESLDETAVRERVLLGFPVSSPALRVRAIVLLCNRLLFRRDADHHWNLSVLIWYYRICLEFVCREDMA
jgi:hypothetical protein